MIKISNQLNIRFLVSIRKPSFCAAICILLFFTACQTQTTEQAALPDEKLAQIMADLSVADAATTGLSGYPKDSLMQAYFKQVFEIHGVSMEAYEKDLRILASDLPHFDRVVKKADTLLTEGISPITPK